MAFTAQEKALFARIDADVVDANVSAFSVQEKALFGRIDADVAGGMKDRAPAVATPAPAEDSGSFFGEDTLRGLAQSGAIAGEAVADLNDAAFDYTVLGLGTGYAQKAAEAVGADSLADGIGGARDSIRQGIRSVGDYFADSYESLQAGKSQALQDQIAGRTKAVGEADSVLGEIGTSLAYTAKNPGLALDDAAQSGLITGGTALVGRALLKGRRLGGDGHAGGISLGRGGGGRLHGRRCRG